MEISACVFSQFRPGRHPEVGGAIMRRHLRKRLQTEQIDPLILTPMFILDFLCIHPFNDGNGRMSRLTYLACCYIGRVILRENISVLKKLIEQTQRQLIMSRLQVELCKLA